MALAHKTELQSGGFIYEKLGLIQADHLRALFELQPKPGARSPKPEVWQVKNSQVFRFWCRPKDCHVSVSDLTWLEAGAEVRSLTIKIHLRVSGAAPKVCMSLSYEARSLLIKIHFAGIGWRPEVWPVSDFVSWLDLTWSQSWSGSFHFNLSNKSSQMPTQKLISCLLTWREYYSDIFYCIYI